jgi:phosphoribosylaminoimidazole carboxylase
VGVLGGGQLGRMLAQEAVKMGVRLRVLDPTTADGDGETPGCPAAAVAQQTLGSFSNPDDVAAFAASGVDILTVEIEHVDADALEKVAAASGVDVEPTPATLRLIQDKFGQKRHFADAGVAVADHAAVPDLDAAVAVGERFGYPFMLKARRGAYDGKGNAVVVSRADVEAAARSLGGFETGNLYAEKWAPFVKELAVMVARSRSGEVLPFPVVETVHRDSICWVTEAPADVSPRTREAAAAAAAAAVAALDGAGVFGVEMFLLPDGSLLLNEVAPRPHNSGHYTIEGCVTSQFEQHLRAVLGWPLGDPSLRGSGAGGVGGESAIMLNILGAADGDAGVVQAHETMARAYATPGASVHWYGKDGVAKGRKVGHVTILGRSRAEARARLARVDADAALALEKSSPSFSPSSSSSTNMFPPTTAKVGIIMGSDSDLPTMAAARDALLEFGIEAEVTVVSAHRTPDRMVSYAREAASRGIKVIIAGAGGAAHLPGMVAAMTPLPVVGVPVVPTSGGRLDGMDALLSIVQMPRGVPVATVAIGNAANAGLLAARILGCEDATLRGKMEAWQLAQRDVVLGKAARLEEGGVDAYLGRK